MPYPISKNNALIILKGLPGLFAILISQGRIYYLTLGLIAMGSLFDLLVDSYFKKKNIKKTSLDVQLEGFADFIGFIWAPTSIILVTYENWILGLALVVFVISGSYRLARFNVEGMIKGGYRGLPVTYNGIIIPILLLLFHFIPINRQIIVISLALLLLSLLMVSNRFITPRVSL